MWLMTSKKRIYTLALLVPIIAFIVIGGFFSQAMTRDDIFRHLAVFNDVVSIVLKNYVEEVDITPAVEGAMRGLSEALDSDSAYLTQELVQSIIVKDSLGKAEIGLDVIRQSHPIAPTSIRCHGTEASTRYECQTAGRGRHSPC